MVVIVYDAVGQWETVGLRNQRLRVRVPPALHFFFETTFLFLLQTRDPREALIKPPRKTTKWSITFVH
jgi:hypothetical protein